MQTPAPKTEPGRLCARQSLKPQTPNSPQGPASPERSRSYFHDWRLRPVPARSPRPLRPRPRTRFLRRRLRRRHEEPQEPRDRRSRACRSCSTSIIAARSAPIPKLGDGCGILVQIPHRVLREASARSSASSCRSRASTASASSSCRATRRAARSRSRRSSSSVHRGRGPDASRLARRAGRQFAISARAVKATEPVHPPDLHRPRPRRRPTRTISSAGSIVARKVDLERDLRRSKDAAHRRATTPCRCPAARSSTRAWCSSRQLGAYYKDLQRPALRERARARAPALRDQHLPVLAARPSLSHGRAQRRDQHAARQRQLDGGAPGLGRFEAVRQRHLEALADLLRGPVGHRLLRQRARVPRAGRLFARPRDDDADPRGLGRQPAHGRGAPRLLRIPRRADGAVGRPGRDRASPTAARSARRSTATACARRAISSPTTISS